jgi:hypothetical protein
MRTQKQSKRERLQNVIIEAIKDFANKEGQICIADLEFMLGHNSHLLNALFKKMKVIW